MRIIKWTDWVQTEFASASDYYGCGNKSEERQFEGQLLGFVSRHETLASAIVLMDDGTIQCVNVDDITRVSVEEA